MGRKLSIAYNKYDNSKMLRLLYIILLSLPPAFIFSLKDPTFLKKIEVSANFLMFLNPEGSVFNILAYAWVPFFTGLMHFLGLFAKKDYYYLNQQGFVTLVECIDNVVAHKSNNIADNLNNNNSKELEKILDPDKQIKKIIDYMFIYLNKVFKDKDPYLQITLLKVKKDNDKYSISNFFHHAPEKESPSVEIDLFHNEKSCAGSALKYKRYNVVENTKSRKGKKRFKFTDKCEDCDGCNILSYPLFDRKLDDIYYVLNITHKFQKNKNIIFKNKIEKIKIYKEILKRFNDRLLLECRKKALLEHKWGIENDETRA